MHPDEIETIAQSRLSLMNPVTREMILRAGELAAIRKDAVIYDLGCGNGTLLALWHDTFGIRGNGIELRKESAAAAKRAIEEKGAADQIHIIEGDAAAWEPEEEADVVVAIGSAFIFGGAAPALAHFESLTKPGGRIIIGDRYWQSDRISPEFAVQWQEIPTEYGLVAAARDLGLSLRGVIRASPEDHDRYESAIWQQCLRWLDEHQSHPDREEMEEYICRIQDEYLVYGREAFGWAIWVFGKDAYE